MTGIETQGPARGLGRSMATGAVWMVCARFAVRAIGLVSTVVLARLLVPEDFGLVALATMLVGLLEVLSEFSFDVFLIQHQTASRSHYDSAWTLSILRGLLMAVLLLVFSVPAALFFDEPRLSLIVQWLALSTFIKGFTNIGIVDFRKRLQFGKDFAFMVWAKIGSFIVTIVLAFLWRDYWALVAGIMSGTFAQVALSYVMQSYRPRLSLSAWRDIIGFSKWLLLNNLLGFASGRGDKIVIGKLIGAQALGLYTVGFEIANLVTSEIVAPIRRALLPGYSMLARDPAQLRESFCHSLALIVAIGSPAAIGILLIADQLVWVFLGEKWVGTIGLIQMLSLAGLLTLSASNCGSVYLAMGRPRLSTVVFTVVLSAKVPLVIVGAYYWGVNGVAVGIIAANGLELVINIWLVCGLLDVRLSAIAMGVWRSVLSTLAMVAVVSGVKGLWPQGHGFENELTQLLAVIAIGAVSYLAAHFALWRLSGRPVGPEHHLIYAIAPARR